MTEQKTKNEEAIFLAALERMTPQERRAFVDGACAGDQELLQRVNELLDAHDDSVGPLDSPPMGLKATIDNHPIAEQPGTRIGSYKLLQQIGEGGFGVVYLAEQIEPVRRKVALKIIKPGMDTKEVVARFEAERQALALMDHPNVAKVFDGGATESGRPYFVMELVKGIPLTEFCDANKLATTERLELFTSVCRAVQHAHHKGVIHRDLKPSNVMVTLHDGRPVPKVIDFGVSKAISQQLTEKTLFTAYGQMIGTPAYMSPEQAEMSGLDIDTRSDIYSLGVLLYELLTGSTPLEAEKFRGAAYAEMQRMIREDEPPKPSTRLSTLGEATATVAACRATQPDKLGALVRGDLDWIVMRALAKDRERRYESANSFADDIERFLKREPVEACPPSLGYRLQSYMRRNKRALLVAGTIQALLFIGIFVSISLAVRMLNERDRANSAERLARERLAEVRREQVKTRDALDDERSARAQAVAAERQAVHERQEALKQKDEAEKQRRNAEKHARIADARRLAARSRETLKEHPTRSLLLAVEAVLVNRRAQEPHVPVAEQALREALAAAGASPHVLSGQSASGASPDGRWLVTSSPMDIEQRNGNETRLWDLIAKNPTKASLSLSGHARGIFNLTFSPDSRWLVTAGWERKARLWDLSKDDPSRSDVTLLTGMETEFDLRFPPVLWCNFSENGRWLVMVGPDFNTRVWDMTQEVHAKPHLNIPAENNSRAINVQVSPDNRWMAAIGLNEGVTMIPDRKVHLRVWDLNAKQPQEMHLGGHVGGIAFYQFSADSRWLITGAVKTKTVWVWDLHRDNPASKPLILDGHMDAIGQWLLSPDRQWLATTSADAQTRIWKLSPSARPMSAYVLNRHGDQEHPHFVGFSPNSRWFATQAEDANSVSLWDLPSPIPLAEQPPRRVNYPFSGQTQFSPDSRWLVRKSYDQGRLHLTDLTPGKMPSGGTELPRPIGEMGITSSSFSSDGRWLAAFYNGDHSCLWNLSNPDPPVTPIVLTGVLSKIARGVDSRHNYGVRNLPFSGDGRWLVTRYRTDDGEPNTAFWELRIEELINLAQSTAGRSLSAEERQQYMIP